jgi:hypothetical protein
MPRNWPAETEASGVLDDLALDDLTYLHRGVAYVQDLSMQVADKAALDGDLEKAVQCIARASDMDVLLDRITLQIERLGYFFDEDGHLSKKVEEVA